MLIASPTTINKSIIHKELIILDDNKEWFKKDDTLKHEVWSSYYLSHNQNHVLLFINKNNTSFKLNFLSDKKPIYIHRNNFNPLLKKIEYNDVYDFDFRFKSIIIANFFCSIFCSWKRSITNLQEIIIKKIFLKNPELKNSFKQYRGQYDEILFYRHKSIGLTSIAVYPDGIMVARFYSYRRLNEKPLKDNIYHLTLESSFEEFYNDLKFYGSKKIKNDL